MELNRSHANNFDLLRLLAALQVVFIHGFRHLELNPASPTSRMLLNLFRAFPGVPVFFIISGFLISMSFERSRSGVLSYFRNRLLRIYPALWAAFLVSIGLLLAAGFLSRPFVLSGTFLFWVFGQLGFVQQFNPDHFRSFGTGIVNGSLWTIPVEIGFYLALPLLYAFLRLRTGGRLRGNLLLAFLVAASFALYLFLENDREEFVRKCLYVSILPHLWMFLFGMLIYRNFDRLKPLLEGRFLYWLAPYLALHYSNLDDIASLAPICTLASRILLALTVISAAFTRKNLSNRLLKGHDISYGVYLYHMLAVNALLCLGLKGTYLSLLVVAAVTVVLASLSWVIVERPALALKARTLGRMGGTATAEIPQPR